MKRVKEKVDDDEEPVTLPSSSLCLTTLLLHLPPVRGAAIDLSPTLKLIDNLIKTMDEVAL